MQSTPVVPRSPATRRSAEALAISLGQSDLVSQANRLHSTLQDMMEDEDYEFDYEDSDQDQDDGQVDMENEYYTAKGERCTSAFLRRKR